MGYTKNENGELVIVPEEAEIVRLVFRLYLEGNSARKIGQYLEEQGIKTVTDLDKWRDTVIMKMLRNEKYMGDALLQKTYMVDFMTKKKVINNGIMPQYYVEDDHEPIIPKELFYRVQGDPAACIHVQVHSHPQKEPKEQIFIRLCADGHPAVRRVWVGVPEGHMGKEDRVRTCYMQACLAYVNYEAVSNGDIRKLFGLSDKEMAKASRLIQNTIDAGLIKPVDPETAPRYKKYIPYWA